MKIPLLFLSDSPCEPTGLARIGRDLAQRVHSELGEIYRVGYLGRGGMGGSFPYPHWIIPHSLYGSKNTTEWGSTVLPEVWRQFAGQEKGVVFSIWDPGRMIWLSRPEHLVDSPAKTFLLSKPFETWGYFPIDGHTPVTQTLGWVARESLEGYNRVAAYTEYGAKVIERALGVEGKKHFPYFPHGIDDVWHPRDREKAREALDIRPDAFLVGVVATNQRRKDWGLAAAVGAMLKKHYGNRFVQWWHTDQGERDWSIPQILREYDLHDNTLVTLSPQSDDWMAAAYSACDVTLAIGAGEGFGYPIVESQACGCPVLHVNYAGGADFVPKMCRINPTARYWLEGSSAVMRPISDAEDWFIKAKLGRALPVGDMGPLRWDKLWPFWRRWFLEVYGA